MRQKYTLFYKNTKCHFKIRSTGLPKKNIKILFEPNEMLFDLTHKTPIKSASLCVLPPIFMGEENEN